MKQYRYKQVQVKVLKRGKPGLGLNARQGGECFGKTDPRYEPKGAAEIIPQRCSEFLTQHCLT